MKKKDKELHLLYGIQNRIKKPKTIAIHYFTYGLKKLYSFLGGVLLKNK